MSWSWVVDALGGVVPAGQRSGVVGQRHLGGERLSLQLLPEDMRGEHVVERGVGIDDEALCRCGPGGESGRPLSQCLERQPDALAARIRSGADVEFARGGLRGELPKDDSHGHTRPGGVDSDGNGVGRLYRG